MVVLFSIFWGNSILFSMVAAFFIPIKQCTKVHWQGCQDYTVGKDRKELGPQRGIDPKGRPCPLSPVLIPGPPIKRKLEGGIRLNSTRAWPFDLNWTGLSNTSNEILVIPRNSLSSHPWAGKKDSLQLVWRKWSEKNKIASCLHCIEYNPFNKPVTSGCLSVQAQFGVPIYHVYFDLIPSPWV